MDGVGRGHENMDWGWGGTLRGKAGTFGKDLVFLLRSVHVTWSVGQLCDVINRAASDRM